MPIPKKDPYSGAILFHPTPEEQEVIDLKNELAMMKEEMSKKLSELDELLKNQKSGKKK